MTWRSRLLWFALGVLVTAVSVFGYFMYQAIQSILGNPYYVWHASAMVIDYMKTHDNRWPAGEYGLKVGHDGLRDPDTQIPFPQGVEKLPPAKNQKALNEYSNEVNKPSEPWKCARVVKVKAGEVKTGVELEHDGCWLLHPMCSPLLSPQ